MDGWRNEHAAASIFLAVLAHSAKRLSACATSDGLRRLGEEIVARVESLPREAADCRGFNQPAFNRGLDLAEAFVAQIDRNALAADVLENMAGRIRGSLQ